MPSKTESAAVNAQTAGTAAKAPEAPAYHIPLNTDTKDKVETQKRVLIAELRAYCKAYGVRPSTDHLAHIVKHGNNPLWTEYLATRTVSMQKRIVQLARDEMINAKEMTKQK